jgi:anti-sigma regulatory factor (Ser/Thr protein kinase)
VASNRLGAEWTLPALDESVGEARHLVAGLLATIAPERLDTILLLTSELVTNAVRHGSGPVTLHLSGGVHGLQVEVDDDGAGQPVLLDPDALTTGGRGLHLVDALSTRWGVDRHALGKTVWFRLL